MPDNAPGRRHASQLAKTIAEEFGVKLNWIKGDTFFNGVAYGGEVFIDVNSDTPHHIVLDLEIVHVLKKEHPDLYQQLVDMIIPQATDRAGSADFHQKPEGSAAANEEYVGDVVGNRFGERQYWEDMAATDPSLFRKVATILKDFLAKITSKFSKDKLKYGDAVRDLNKVRATVSSVMMKYRQRQKAGMSQVEFADKYSDPLFSRKQKVDTDAILSQWRDKLSLAGESSDPGFTVYVRAPLILRDLNIL